MPITCKYAKYEYDGQELLDIVKQFNHPSLNSSVLSMVEVEFNNVNDGPFTQGDDVFVPVLKPFWKKHEGLIDTVQQKIPEVVEEEVVEIPSEPTFPPNTVEREWEVKTPDPIPQTEPETVIPSAPKKEGKLQYKLYPYTFSRQGETIEAIIRVYNDMSITRPFIARLVKEFTVQNPESRPPKLGQTVKVPVLLPFCFRHENKNEIFADDKDHKRVFNMS